MVHFSILPATPARQCSPERGPAGIVQWIRVTFPSSKAEGAALMWLSEDGLVLLSAHRTGTQKDRTHECPHQWLWKKGKSGMKNRLRGWCDSPHSPSLWISPIFTFTELGFFNKNPSSLIANNLIVLLIWRTYLPLIHLKKKGKKILPPTWKLIILTDLRWICQVCMHFFKKLESCSGLCPVGFWISAEKETPQFCEQPVPVFDHPHH